MTGRLAALAFGLLALPTAAMAQDAATDALRGVGINCSMPGSFCSSTKTTITTGSDGGTTTTSEKKRTVGGVPVDDDAPKARKVIQPARDSSPMPGMRYDPALGYYVPNTPAPAKPAPTPQTTDQDQTAEQESRQRLGFTNPLR